MSDHFCNSFRVRASLIVKTHLDRHTRGEENAFLVDVRHVIKTTLLRDIVCNARRRGKVQRRTIKAAEENHNAANLPAVTTASQPCTYGRELDRVDPDGKRQGSSRSRRGARSVTQEHTGST